MQTQDTTATAEQFETPFEGTDLPFAPEPRSPLAFEGFTGVAELESPFLAQYWTADGVDEVASPVTAELVDLLEQLWDEEFDELTQQLADDAAATVDARVPAARQEGHRCRRRAATLVLLAPDGTARLAQVLRGGTMKATRPRWIAFEGADDEVLAEIAELELEDASGGEQTWLDGEDFGGLEPEADVEAELFDTERPRASRPAAFYVEITEELPRRTMKGDVVPAPHTGKIAGINFHFGVVAPRDVASGAASGAFQYSAVTMTKYWTAASPLLLDALVRNRTLPKVVFEFVSNERSSPENVLQKLTLRDAVVTSMRQVIDGGRQIEEVAFKFKTIELENVAGGTRAQSSHWGGTSSEV